MAKRVLLAGLLGGLILFVWEFVAHEALPLGEAGLKALPNEPAARAALKQAAPDTGLYIFPAPDLTPGMTRAQQQQAMQVMLDKIRTGPVGILAIHPDGVPTPFAQQLATQFATDVVAMLLAAALLARAAASRGFGGRLLLVTLLGLLPSLRAGIPYWNWYGFPATYVAAQATVDVVGFFLGGLVLAWLVRPGDR
ncbi:MAG: hypothetical protein LAP87_12420 [Acidobacteriia bacterium]|nr:hypothetical protein [Terriglobia bacterium]